MIALGIAAVSNFVAYFYSDKIALMSMGAQEVGPDHELYQITAGLAQRAGLPMPRVYVAPRTRPTRSPPGATRSTRPSARPKGCCEILNRNEVAGVMAHELAHVKHRDILITTVAATIARRDQLAGVHGHVVRRHSSADDDEGGIRLGGLLMMILGPIAAAVIQAAISRSREYNADTEGRGPGRRPDVPRLGAGEAEPYAKQIPLEANPAYNSMFIVAAAEPFRGMANLFSRIRRWRSV